MVVGLPAAGKSLACEVLETRLQRDGYQVTRLSDKSAFETEVRRDVGANGRPGSEPGSLEGKHCILLNPEAPPGTLRVLFKDAAALLNGAHEALLREVASRVDDGNASRVLLVEWAYGVDHAGGSQPLRQSGTQLVLWLREFGLAGRAVVLDVVADYAERERRNLARRDSIPRGEFGRYFPEAGHLRPEDVRYLGRRYTRIENAGVTREKFQEIVAERYGSVLAPVLPRLSARPGRVALS